MTQDLAARAWGHLQETEAVRILLPRYQAGTRVVARNATFKCGELDAVLIEPCKRGLEVVFVEIRARAGAWGVLETWTRRKHRNLERAIQVWLCQNKALLGGVSAMRVDLWLGERGGWRVLRDLRRLP